MIEIDGAQGEGGGQILRTALTLSIVTQQAIHISRIRANRSKPGLAAQHLAGVVAAGRICQAEIVGAGIGATELTFAPRSSAVPGSYQFDISELAGMRSAGSVTLLLQAILLPFACAHGPSKIVLKGGTHVPWSPPAQYVESVLLPTLARMGVEASCELISWGFYPKGGGELHVTIAGNCNLNGINLRNKGKRLNAKGLGIAANLSPSIAARIASQMQHVLRAENIPHRMKQVNPKGLSSGAAAFLSMTYENAVAGFSALGEKGKPAEAVANEAAEALAMHDQHPSGHALDQYLPDQLLVAMALARGGSSLSTTEITQHTLTNASVIGRFLNRTIEIQGGKGQPGVILVHPQE